MKYPPLRNQLAAGAFIVLFGSLSSVIAGNGKPIGEGATPVGEGATRVGEGATRVGEGATRVGEGAVPVGEGATPVGEGATPVGEGATPVGEGAVPVGEGAAPVGEGAAPVGEGAIPVGEGAVPVGEGAVPIGEGTVPVGEGATPVGEGAVPVGEGAVPVGEGAFVLNKNAQQQRMTNLATARALPVNAPLFNANAAARNSNAVSNFNSAITAPIISNEATNSQREAEDRQWAASAMTSAASRPTDLFTLAWWNSHSNVLPATSRYYTTKPAFTWWQGTPWDVLVQAYGISQPVGRFKYLYDQDITFQNDIIYVNGKAVSSYDDFVASAQQLANSGKTVDAESRAWYPLGTYLISSSFTKKTASHAVQLAINGKGSIAGVYVNWPKGDVIPVSGKLDPNTQRVAISIGSNNSITLETGLENLTNDSTRLWAHLPNKHSQTWLMVRMKPAGE